MVLQYSSYYNKAHLKVSINQVSVNQVSIIWFSERGARRGSHDSIDDVFLELKLAEADLSSSSSSDEETGIYAADPEKSDRLRHDKIN